MVKVGRVVGDLIIMCSPCTNKFIFSSISFLFSSKLVQLEAFFLSFDFVLTFIFVRAKGRYIFVIKI